MITKRTAQKSIITQWQNFPGVVLLGARQIGKTTLAHQLVDGFKQLTVAHPGLALAQFIADPKDQVFRTSPDGLYLDMENPTDHAKMADPVAFFANQKQSLIAIDEIQARPELFATLRSIIDEGIRRNDNRKYLFLGSASASLHKRATQTLTGRAAYVHMSGLKMEEVGNDWQNLWLRGGYPMAYLAQTDQASLAIRESLLQSILGVDIPSLEPTFAASVPSLRRFWQMMAHLHGQLFNASSLANSLGMSATTVKRYKDLFEAMDLLRVLPPWSKNDGKRLTKSPRVYIRDSGLLHGLLRLGDMEQLFGHPVFGASWEGFVLEQTLPFLGLQSQANYYRTHSGAEIDLILEGPNETWAVEIKSNSAPKLSRGFVSACDHIKPSRKIIVYSGNDPWAYSADIEVLPLGQFVKEVQSAFG